MATYVPPRDAFELQVAVTIGDALSREAVGALDDVADIVNDRVRAGAVIDRLTRLLGRRMSYAQLRRCHTVEEVAASYRALPADGRWCSLVTMKRPPAGGCALVIVHPLGGNAFWYLNLARLVGGELGVYALHARGLDLAEAPHRDIGAMAQAYLADVRAEIPNGPYAFAGWSFGGIVASEMSRQLTAADEAPPLLVMFDCGPDNRSSMPATSEVALGFLMHALRLDNVAQDVAALPSREQVPAALQMAQRRATLPAGFTTAEVLRMLELNVTHLAMMAEYRFSPTAADVLLFRATDAFGPDGAPLSRALGWERASAGSVEVHHLPGTHFEVLDRVHHDAIAARLRTALASRTPIAASEPGRG